MKRLLGILSIIGLVIGVAGCTGKLSTPDMVKHTSNSSVALVYYDEDNDDSDISDIRVYCSGIWVNETHILTAEHCVKFAREEAQKKQDAREGAATCDILSVIMGKCDLDSMAHKEVPMLNLPVHYVVQSEVTGLAKEPTTWHLGNVTGWDSSHDLALIQVSGNGPTHEVAELAKAVPATGEYVSVVGHPRGWYWTFLQGTVAGYRNNLPGDDQGPYLQVQVPAYYGNSGGGAFDAYGKLIGMADLLNGIPSETLFVPVDPIRNFLVEQKVLKQ